MGPTSLLNAAAGEHGDWLAAIVNILFVCHRIPFPPKRGGKIRPFNMISHLAREHAVTVASLARNEAEREAASGLAEHCERVICEVISDVRAGFQMLARAPTSIPFSMGYFYSASLKRRISQELRARAYDLIIVHCSSVAQYVADVQGIPKILDFGDMDSQKWRLYANVRRFPMTVAYWLEAVKLEREERRLAQHFDLATCTTRQELDTLDSYQVARRTSWFPNGVDHEYFAPYEEFDPDLVSFIGRMDYYPNQECVTRFCDDVWPLVRKHRPSTRFVIVGAEPPAAIRRLGSIQGVEVTGSVDDVRPYVARSAVNVATLSVARGTQNKILEAMAMGVPVVASTVAAKGVDAVVGEHLLAADEAEEIATQLLSVLDDPQRRQQLSTAGRARVLSHHHWPESMKRLDVIVADAMSEPIEKNQERVFEN